MMMEMNPDVKGEGLVMAIDDFIRTKSSMIASCQLLVACDVTVQQAITLSSIDVPNYDVPN